MTLDELLNEKAGGLIYVQENLSVLEAIDTMCNKKVGSLLVETADGKLLGIATERDILRLCSERKGDFSDTKVSQAMTKELMVASPETSVDDAMTMMTEHRFRHLPVLKDGKAIGMISIGDLVKARLKDVTVEVKYLRDYISM
ncbi:MAG: CBS domain-containing protein [Gammaproteobacteria bacterium]|nr:CBS domain-containing protein [Gammaproteobacteria bacterium]